MSEPRSKFGGVPVSAPVQSGSKFGGIPVGQSLMTPPVERPGIGKRLLGSAEAATTLATGFPAQVAGGLGGIYELVSGAVSGRKNNFDSAANRVNRIAEQMTYQPKTESGQDILGMVSAPFQKLEEVTRGAGNIALEQTGSPAVATAVKTGLEYAPALAFGARPRTMGQRREDISRTQQEMRGAGVNLGDSMESQRAQMGEIAARSTQGQQIRAQEMSKVQQAVQTAEQIAEQNVDRLYTEARQFNTSVPVRALAALPATTRAALKDYIKDIDLMPIARKRLEELDQLGGIPQNYAVRLEEIEGFRRRVNKMRPASTDISQQAVLGIIKGQIDNALDGAFNSAMIKGDPAGIQAWREARTAFRDYKKTFEEQKVINQLATQQATPEEVRNWIFGASAVGAKKEAGRVIGSLKGILGEDSPAFGALRQEALFDVMEPLLRETPDYAGYVQNYDQFVRSSPSVAKELFPQSIEELGRLRSYANAANKVSPQRMSLDINQSVARAFFGHDIAKSAMKVSLAGQALGLLRRAAGKSEQQRVISEMLGYDTSKGLIPLSPVVAASGAQTAIDQGQRP